MVGGWLSNYFWWILLDSNVIHDLFSYDTLGAENIPYVLNHTNLTTLFCSKESLDILLKCDNTGSVKNVVSFDNIPEATIQAYKEKGIAVYIYQDLLKKYEKLDIKI